MTKKWLSVEEAADYIGISKTQLYQLAQEKSIPASKVGKQWRFNTSELDKWIKQSTSIEDFFIKTDYDIVENDSLRDPQREAYLAVYDHFQQSNDTAIIQIPVGCGKSGIAAIIPFGIAKGRVLVITPNLTIKKGMKDTLNVGHRKCFWKIAHVLDKESMAQGPFVTDLEESNMSVADKSHFVVTNVHQLSTNPEKWLKKFDQKYFDMIIVDEAHHSPADSWQVVFDHFSSAKVIYLTATPFRSDQQEVKGTLVYRYSFQEASLKGYIKRLKASYVSPTKLTFTMEGETKTYSLDEILKLKEETWFSRGVALSQVSNTSIVDNSIVKLQELREQTGTQHQLIAVAMSIAHAKMICSLYQERDLNTAIIHSRMKKDERAEVLNSLRNGTLDCIVQVQMLGEGFDHQKLSVAAIFRPFRSLSPYIQFVGRIMRVVVQNQPGHPDNYGHIVTHIGLNVDELLKQFQDFDKNDEDFWASVLGGADPLPPKKVTDGSASKKMQPDMVVNEELVELLFQEDFIADDRMVLDELKRKMSELGVDPALAEQLLAQRESGRKSVVAPSPLRVQPQQAWKHKRRRLNIEIRTKAKVLLNVCDLQPMGKEIPFQYNLGARANNNLVAAIILFNKEIQKIIGKEDERKEWSEEDFDKAVAELPEIGKKLVRKVKAIQSGKR